MKDWVDLLDGRSVPIFIMRGFVWPSDTGRRRKALRFPNGSIYMLRKGQWKLTGLGMGERFQEEER